VLNANDRVQVHYVGVKQADGTEFDTSWDSEPVTFGLDEVITGWTEGIPGMKVGGRRVLVIPEDKAYQGGEPSGTLVFIVDLLAVNPGETTTTTAPAPAETTAGEPASTTTTSTEP
jgi:peptidylprolyl isomerase